MFSNRRFVLFCSGKAYLNKAIVLFGLNYNLESEAETNSEPRLNTHAAITIQL